jgi:uncharacterized Tic20 family protein
MNTDSISQDDKTMALLAHLGGIFFGFIPSLVIWLIKKDSSPFVADQAKEALNFQITLIFGYILSVILMFIIIGIFMVWALVIANLVLCIIAGIKANGGESYRYPFAIRLIK